MGLHGKLIAAVEFKKGGDIFHDLFASKPHHVSKIIPHKVQGFDLHEGEMGKVGSIISWRYTEDGKEKMSKQIVQAIDEEKKIIEFKNIEGNLMEEFKDFVCKIHIETKGDNIDLVTWTFEYESLTEDTEHPYSLLKYCVDFTKEIENHYVSQDI